MKSQSELVEALSKKIHSQAIFPMTIMEVCGTHTQAIFANGIRSLLPKTVSIISGPGCPVCVTAQSDVERMIWLSSQKDVAVCTFGDMVRVPGKTGSLAKSRSKGADIRVVYSPFDVIGMAQKDKTKEFVLIGIGFETTVPGFAATIKRAKELELRNLSMFSLHKTVPLALLALAKSGQVKVDGLILPGHVSAIIGTKPYEFLAKDFGIPGTIVGFEGFDIIVGLQKLIEMIAEKKPSIENMYPRIVRVEGNVVARQMIEKVFGPSDALWRGIGNIPGSGLSLRREFDGFDALKKFDMPYFSDEEPKGCLCGQVILGVVTPLECSLFSRVCTPINPIGPCMVSGEGTCSAYYKYQREAVS